MDFTQIIEDYSYRLLAEVETSRRDLKAIVGSANEAVGSAESSILVLNEAKTHLRFLVSLNEELDNSDVEIERHKAISGFVFDSGQMVAEAKPKSEGSCEVDRKSGIQTDFLVAVPVMSDHRVIAVGTFVNRAEEVPDQGFMKKEIDMAQDFAELYATGLNTHRQAVLAYQVACRQLSKFAKEMNLNPEGFDCLKKRHTFASGFEESIFSIDQKLTASQRSIWRRFGQFLAQDGEGKRS